MSSEIHIRTHLQPGDLGYLIYLHGALYHDLCGFDQTFESYVATLFVDFVDSQDHLNHQIWIAEQKGKIVGCIGIMDRENRQAQLRWLLIDPSVRGQGLGARLVDMALAYCQDQDFSRVYLDTVRQLGKAAGLYRSRGFEKINSIPEVRWGQQLFVERYEMQLEKG